MATVTGNGFLLPLTGRFGGGISVVGPTSSTGFMSSTGVTFTGTNLTYGTTQISGGPTRVTLTGGIITGFSLDDTAGDKQTYSNLNISAADFVPPLLNDTDALNQFLFSGDDTLIWSGKPSIRLLGLNGNDTFTLSNWNIDPSNGALLLDGGAGTDTVNLVGGIPTYFPQLSYFDLMSTGNYAQNFSMTNVEIVNLAAGADYVMFFSTDVVTAGNTMTVDGSALGASNSMVFDTNISTSAVAGNLVLIGGAGPDYFQGGTGNNVFNGGSGQDTVSFAWGQNIAGRNSGVTVDLSITGSQSFGTGAGSGTLISIENLVGTKWNDTLTGNASDNVLMGGDGSDVLNGGAGFDAAVYSLPLSFYQISRSGSTVTITGAGGTDTLTSVETAVFKDQILRISGPIVTTNNTRVAAGQSVALSSLFTVTDLNGAAITAYQLWDSNANPNSGHFVVAGSAQSASAAITITAGQLAQTSFVGGALSDTLQIRAFDGTSWSASDNGIWMPFVAGPSINNPPVVTTATRASSRGQVWSLSSLFTVSDGDGDAMTRYQLWDSNRDPNSGYFTINGVKQNAGTIIDITAADLANTAFVAGKVSDTLQIRAFDGFGWSAADSAIWSPFTVAVTPDNAPLLATHGVTVAPGQLLSLSSLATYSDADSDSVTAYQLWDSNRDPLSGHWVVNGLDQAAGTIITVTASDAAQTFFQSGSVADNLQVRASDGVLWSAADTSSWAPFTVAPPVNHAPVVTTSNQTYAPGQSLALSTLFNVSDSDGDSMAKYQLWNATRDAGAGYFSVNGTPKAAGTLVEITAAQLAQTTFVTGSVATNLQIRAFDGVAWSAADSAAWAPFAVSPPVNHAPVLTTSDKSSAPGQTLALSTLFNVSDADGDSMTKYQLWNATRDPNAGYFTVNGTAKAAGTLVEVTGAQLAQTAFVTGSVATNLQIRAFDGAAWSAADSAGWSPFTVAPPPNHAPMVVGAGNPQHGQTVALSSLLTVADADGDTITKYQLWDATTDPKSGHFVVAGIDKPARTLIEITAAEYAQTFFVAGEVSDSLQVRAFDGKNWSAADNAAWSPFNVYVLPNSAPQVLTADTSRAQNQVVPLSNLFSILDWDGDTMTRYQLWDSTANPNSGHWVVNGVDQAAGTLVDISASQLAQTSFQTGTVGDTLQIRAFDGYAWSAADTASWSPFHVTV